MRTGPLVRNIAILAVLLGIVIVVIGRMRVGGARAPSAPTAPRKEEPEKTARRMEMQGPTTVSRRDATGQKVWEAGVKGGWRMDEASGDIVGNEVSWRIVGEGIEGLQVTSGEFEAEEQSDVVVFRDNVAATLPRQKAKFQAQQLRYDVRTRQLDAEGNIVLDWGKLHVTGQRLTADVGTDKIRVHGKVRMTYEG